MPFALIEPVEPVIQTLAEAVEEATRYTIVRALNQTHGCISAAALLLGVSHATIHRLLRKHRIVAAQVVADYRPNDARLARQRAKGLRGL